MNDPLQLRTSVILSIGKYVEFWKDYDFEVWEESARAGFSDLSLPEDYDSSLAPSLETKRIKNNANFYWRATHQTLKWGEDLFAAMPRVIFSIQLVVRDVSGNK